MEGHAGRQQAQQSAADRADAARQKLSQQGQPQAYHFACHLCRWLRHPQHACVQPPPFRFLPPFEPPLPHFKPAKAGGGAQQPPLHETDINFDNAQQPNGKMQQFYLGAWYNKIFKKLDLMRDMRQERGALQGKQAAGDFCGWLRAFVETYVDPLAQQHVCSKFQAILTEQQEVHWPWAAEHCNLDTYCHPLYLTASPFYGFSNGFHADVLDSPVSVLFTFGQHTLLKLPEYRHRVELQPLNGVFFQSSSVWHQKTQHLAYQWLECWKL